MTTAAARRLLAATPMVLAALAVAPGSIGARTRPGATRGCGVLVDRAHPVAKPRTGQPHRDRRPLDHGAKREAQHLRSPSSQSTDCSRYRPGPTRPTTSVTCSAASAPGIAGPAHETIVPFSSIDCHLPPPRHPHMAVATVTALADPDPAFIH